MTQYWLNRLCLGKRERHAKNAEVAGYVHTFTQETRNLCDTSAKDVRNLCENSNYLFDVDKTRGLNAGRDTLFVLQNYFTISFRKFTVHRTEYLIHHL